MNNIVEAIVKARELAIKEGIRTNTVLIDEEFARVLPFGFEGKIFPPMICGLKAEICKDMPEEMGIVVFESDMREKELVEVVRCKDCDSWCEKLKTGRAEFGNEVAPCSEWSNEDGYTRYTKPTDFCSYGEKKEK